MIYIILFFPFILIMTAIIIIISYNKFYSSRMSENVKKHSHSYTTDTANVLDVNIIPTVSAHNGRVGKAELTRQRKLYFTQN